MDFQFHCSKRAGKCVKKSKHRLRDCCGDVMKVLMLNPEYGVEVRETGGLRKMRVHVPSLNAGKSGGYRLIYKAMMVDEIWRIALLAGYYKGDCEDLSKGEYAAIAAEAEKIFTGAGEKFSWEKA